MARIEIVGVYPVEAEEPLHLIEARFSGMLSKLDLHGITQEWPGRERSEWQVPYLEHVLNASGDEVLLDWHDVDENPEIWQGEVRVVFYFHYLSFERPLLTSSGQIDLPSPIRLPQRLSNKITYIPT